MEPTGVLSGTILTSSDQAFAGWVEGGDVARIDGGMISAGSIAANAVQIGMRNIAIAGIEFDHQGNTLTWTAGEVSYISDTGIKTSVSIAAGSTSFAGSTVYIYWTQGKAFLSPTVSVWTAFMPENVVIATYNGGANINADYGRTIIDGAKIKTGTVDAQQIAANAVRAINIEAGAIKATHIGSQEITTDKLALGSITTDKMAISSASVVAGSTNYYQVAIPTTWLPITSASLYLPEGGALMVMGASSIGFPNGIVAAQMRLTLNGQQKWIVTGGYKDQDAALVNPAGSFILNVGPGTYTAQLELQALETSAIAVHGSSSISIVGAKR